MSVPQAPGPGPSLAPWHKVGDGGGRPSAIASHQLILQTDLSLQLLRSPTHLLFTAQQGNVEREGAREWRKG